MQQTVSLVLTIWEIIWNFLKWKWFKETIFFSIVDEIDSCLIDEARTPLIISGSAEDKTSQYLAIDKLVTKHLNKLKIMKLMKKIKIFF